MQSLRKLTCRRWTAKRAAQSLFEYLLEKRLHIRPGAFIRGLVITNVRPAMFAMAQAVCIRVGEAVLGPFDADELIVHLGRIHLGLEVLDLLRCDHAVGRAVLDQDIRAYHARFGRGSGSQCAMEAHYAVEFLPTACSIQHHLAAEAVADRTQLVLVGVRLQFQQLKARIEAPGCSGRVFQCGRHERLGILRVLGVLAIAIHVNGQGVIAQRCQVTGAALGIIVQPPPFMHHDNAWALALDGVVVCVVADQPVAVGILVRNFAGLYRRLGKGSAAHQGQSQQDTHGYYS